LRPGGERGDRNEIHFATTLPDDAAGGIISGLRQGSEIIIFLDTLNFLQNGSKLFLTVNHVALSPADIYSNYFLVAYQVATRTVVWYDNRPVNIRLSGDLLETCLKSEPLTFWPEEPWALSKQGSRAAVGRQVIVDAVEGKKSSSSSSSSSPAALAKQEVPDYNKDAMSALSAFAESLGKKEISWKPTLPRRNKLEELNTQLYEELSKEPCSEVKVTSLADQIRELEEISECFPHAKVQSSTNQAVLAAEPPEASKNVRISEQAEIREFEVERISKSTATRKPLVVETPKSTITPFKHQVDLEESEPEAELKSTEPSTRTEEGF
jgi:hypothetical protein